MKKIGLLTVHHAYNYGAVLQSYASLKTLGDLSGNECEIVNYDTKTFRRDRQIFFFPKSASDLMRNIRGLLRYRSSKKRKENFERFMSEHYVLSQEFYTSAKALENAEYEIMITGSDQTFCLHLRDCPKDMEIFFQEFFSHGKKAAYAPSVGEKSALNTPEENRRIADCLKRFDYLSAREEKTAGFIRQLTGTSPDIVLDPTLLLNADEWDKVSAPVNMPFPGEYIFFYTVLSAPWVIEYVKKMSRLLGLKVIALHPKNRFDLKSGFEHLEYCGPDNFLYLLRNAKCVITTSFHGTAFAINYNVPFKSLVVGSGNRILSLLSALSLEDNAVHAPDVNNADISFLKTDFSDSNKLLEGLRNKSIDFLKSIL